jgi:hypothetical protein
MFSNRRGLACLMLVALTIIVAIEPTTAHAYVGPTAGVSFLGAAVGVIVALFSAIGVILFWPVRVLLRKIRGIKSGGAATGLPAAGHEIELQPERNSNHGTL